jgi:hypothetical protein
MISKMSSQTTINSSLQMSIGFDVEIRVSNGYDLDASDPNILCIYSSGKTIEQSEARIREFVVRLAEVAGVTVVSPDDTLRELLGNKPESD